MNIYCEVRWNLWEIISCRLWGMTVWKRVPKSLDCTSSDSLHWRSSYYKATWITGIKAHLTLLSNHLISFQIFHNCSIPISHWVTVTPLWPTEWITLQPTYTHVYPHSAPADLSKWDVLVVSEQKCFFSHCLKTKKHKCLMTHIEKMADKPELFV